MKRWVLGILIFVAGAATYKYIQNLKNEKVLSERKLAEDHLRIGNLSKSLAEEERKLDLKQLEDKHRNENLEQLILAKKKDLQNLDEQIKGIRQNPNNLKAKTDAESDLKLERDRIESLNNQIKNLEKMKSGHQVESKEDQQIIEDRYQSQMNNFKYQIRLVEERLRVLEAELGAIKVRKKDPIAVNERESKAREIAQQKVILSQWRVQESDLNRVHSNEKADLKANIGSDQSQIDSQLLGLRNQLKEEKTRFELADKNLKIFSSSADSMKEQIKNLETQRQALQREITDLQTTH